MAIPPVKMHIVLGGVKEVQKSLKTLQKSLDDVEKTYIKTQKNANRQVESDLKASLSRRESLMKNYERSYIESIKKMHRAESDMGKIRGGAAGGGIGKVRGSRIGIGGGGTGGGISGVAGAGAALGAALGAAGAFSKAISYVTNAVQKTANELISGVTQIGGGFSIADSMVSSASSQRLAVQIASNAGASGGITSGAVGTWSKQMGSSTEFNQLEWTKALKSFQTLTGEISGFKDNAEFFGKLASVSGSSLDDLAKSAGVLKSQFKDLSDADVKEIMLKMWESGKEGVIEITDVNKMAEITGFASMFKGNKKENIMNIVGGAQTVAPMVGGNASEAVTRIKAVLTQLLTNSKKVENIVGYGTMSKDETGKYKFNSVNQGYATMAYLAKYKANQLNDLVPNVRAREAAVALGNRAPDQEKGESTKDYLNRLEKFYDKLNDTTGSISDLDKAFAATKETVEYKLKTLFNEFSTSIGNDLLDTLSDALKDGTIQAGFKSLKDSIPGLVAQFQAMLNMFPIFASALEQLIPLVISAALVFDEIAVQFAMIKEARNRRTPEESERRARLLSTQRKYELESDKRTKEDIAKEKAKAEAQKAADEAAGKAPPTSTTFAPTTVVGANTKLTPTEIEGIGPREFKAEFNALPAVAQLIAAAPEIGKGMATGFNTTAKVPTKDKGPRRTGQSLDED